MGVKEPSREGVRVPGKLQPLLLGTKTRKVYKQSICKDPQAVGSFASQFLYLYGQTAVPRADVRIK